MHTQETRRTVRVVVAPRGTWGHVVYRMVSKPRSYSTSVCLQRGWPSDGFRLVIGRGMRLITVMQTPSATVVRQRCLNSIHSRVHWAPDRPSKARRSNGGQVVSGKALSEIYRRSCRGPTVTEGQPPLKTKGDTVRYLPRGCGEWMSRE